MRTSIKYLTYFMSTVLWMMLAIPSMAQPIPVDDSDAVLETNDGMILVGKIVNSLDREITLETVYGMLTIPIDNIVRVNGDNFQPGEGIVRQHSITMERDGDIRMKYLLPVTRRGNSNQVNILVQGSIVAIEDLNQRPLPFMAQEFDGLSRCVVTLPEYRLPAVYVEIILKHAAVVDNNQLRYSYRYTPRENQSFNLLLNLPLDSSLITASPEPKSVSGSVVYWRETLTRQQSIRFDMNIQLH